jgi:hypothetical protein
VRGEPARDGDEDSPSLRRIAPFAPLADGSLEDLQRMEPGVLAQHCATERRDERVARMSERERAGDESSRVAHRALSVERGEECIVDALGIARRSSSVSSFGQSRRRNVQKPDQPEAHRAMKNAAQRRGRVRADAVSAAGAARCSR